MNKMLTAVAISAATAWAVGYSAMASAEVEAEFYGRVVAGAVYSDNDKGSGNDGTWNLGAVGNDGDGQFRSSRFGFKGTSDLGNGLSAGFKIEREIDTDSDVSQRHNLVYLSGGFGTVTLGNQDNPYMNARHWDQGYFFGGNWHESYRYEGINYAMSTGGFSLNVMAIGNNTNANSAASADVMTSDCTACGGDITITGDAEISGDDGVDGWIIHAGYDFGPVALNVSHHADNKDLKADVSSTGVEGENNTQMTARIAFTDEVRTAIETASVALAAIDDNASADRTAIGVNGTAGPVDWYLAYQTSELNVNVGENDVDSIGGFLGFRMSERDTIYAYHVSHSADRASYTDDEDDGIIQALGEDYTESSIGYTRSIGPGVRFIVEYGTQDRDLPGKDVGSDTNQWAFALRMDF